MLWMQIIMHALLQEDFISELFILIHKFTFIKGKVQENVIFENMDAFSY